MQLSYFYAIISVLIVSLISLVGVFYFSFKSKSLKNILVYAVSFSAGALFGDALLHLLPEVIEESGFTLQVSLSILAGIILFFILEKFIHWRHCHSESSKHVHPFVITNLFGDALHNFIDGLIIGASYLVSIPVGLATTLAVILHEIPQEIGDFALLIHGGMSKTKALLFNFLSALTSVIGVLVAIILSSRIEHITSYLVPFAAGGFLYIAGSDLIPELHKEVKIKNSLLQLFTLLLGIGVMGALLFLE
ncbi:ZIP family metal transporter [Candidatus Woesearchaeota archaeon]|nr:ZIP family metal transporter [Candidatus Woesearchaeota archaeon]HIH25357.1 ZIP family metal transporter [Nanoarchaeota archaeon]